MRFFSKSRCAIAFLLLFFIARPISYQELRELQWKRDHLQSSEINQVVQKSSNYFSDQNQLRNYTSEKNLISTPESLLSIGGGSVEKLPESSKFTYNLESKAAKKAVKDVLKNPKAKKEVIDGLTKMDKGKLLPRNQKYLKGFKNLKEIKLNNTRIIVNPGKGDQPDEIVGIVMRRDLKKVTKEFKNTFK